MVPGSRHEGEVLPHRDLHLTKSSGPDNRRPVIIDMDNSHDARHGGELLNPLHNTLDEAIAQPTAGKQRVKILDINAS